MESSIGRIGLGSAIWIRQRFSTDLIRDGNIRLEQLLRHEERAHGPAWPGTGVLPW